jgi:DNA replication factor GINS
MTANYSYHSLESNVDVIQDTYRMRYLMEDIRITYKRDISINVGGIIIDAREGDISSVPRWLAKKLSEYDIIDIQDNDISAYISRALNRERIAKPHDLSGLDPDFYIRVNEHLKELKDIDREKLIVSLNSFLASRLQKIVKLAAASQLSPELEQKLSAEENELYTSIHHSSAVFKQKVLRKFG